MTMARPAAASGTRQLLPFTEGLHRFSSALGAEARLRPADADPVRRSLVRGAQVIADTAAVMATRPDVAGLHLGRPIFVIGFLRTGSTLVHNLISRHEAVHGPALWELAYPIEAGAAAPAERARLRAQAHEYVTDYFRLAPDLPRVHFIDAGLPDECHRLLANTFHSMVLEMRYRVPSYGDWLHGQDLTEPYRWHRYQLQALMSAHRREDGTVPTPVLKCPFHTWFLAELARVYPEARFIHLHRDPAEVVASTASLCRTVRRARSDDLDLAEIGQLWQDRIANRSARLADARDEMLGDCPVLDLRYREVVADPTAAMHRICDFLELPWSARYQAAVADHLDRYRAERHGRHDYTPQEFGLDPGRIRALTADYRRRFRV